MAAILEKVAKVAASLGVAASLLQFSIYDVRGGQRAVIFDRIKGVKDTSVGEGTHFLVPWLQRAIIYDVRTKPRNIATATGSKDMQAVSLTLRVLHKPVIQQLPHIYQTLGLDYDERVLPSIGNEVLKAVVAQFDAIELITQREVVSSKIREDLVKRSREFNIELEDVSITHMTFSTEFTQAVEKKQIAEQDAERAKFIVEKAEQEKQAAIIRAEGEAEAADKIIKALDKGGEGLVQLRRIEASKEIAATLANSRNIMYIPSGANGGGGSNLLLNLDTIDTTEKFIDNGGSDVRSSTSQQLTEPTQSPSNTTVSTPKPNPIYSAVYSGVPVYEFLVKDVAVMRRRPDSYLNATQILKVAGLDKGKRTKIIEREVLTGEHEKVQGGYGKYQGTWIPFEKALTYSEPVSESATAANSPPPEIDESERLRNILMTIFLNEEPESILDLLVPQNLSEPDINMVIDIHGNSAIHWAACLGRVNILEMLLKKGASLQQVNYDGETALIRSVFVINNYDSQSFPQVVKLLHDTIPITDKDDRSVLHHIAMSSGVRGHAVASKYYMDCLEKWFQSNVCGFLNTILNIQDKNGDTALCIAARVGNNELVEKLTRMGANTDIQNKLGLKPSDFVFNQHDNADEDEENMEDVKEEDMDIDMIQENVSDFFSQSITPFVSNRRKSREVVSALQKLVEDAENEWIVQLKVKEDELFNAQSRFNDLTRQLIDLKRSLQYYRQNEKEYNNTEEYLKFLEQVINEVEEEDNDSIHKKHRINHDDNVLLNKPAVIGSAVNVEITPTSNGNENEMSEKELKTLQAQLSAYRVDKDLLQREIEKLQEKSLSAELQYKQIISTCCKIDLDKVDDFVETILGEVDNDLEDEFSLGRIGEILGKLDKEASQL
ncbi:6812_t:CDS:10 [Entrophospora sp. SA101]|nr:6812_t:CDS:10 [Entrophospora sp. SA101]CAJ0840216.1 16225_t:CDS:10 [Entrophospora sp. SA101]CAJ0914474.1 8458_t:CDS:10 [Entrophospora sp. SA101]